MSDHSTQGQHTNGYQATDGGHATGSAILHLQDVFFRYPEREIFAGLTLTLAPGVSLVQGDAGKTTLLRLMAADLRAQAGRFRINGIALDEQPALYRQQLFWMDPQSTAFDQMTPNDYFKAARAQYPAFDDALTRALVEPFSLTPHQDKPLFMLSSGSKRKVWITAAFASGAALTLLDEPFAALDQASICVVRALLANAATDLARATVIAHYESPPGVTLSKTIDLDA